jgi:hypothetical protein
VPPHTGMLGCVQYVRAGATPGKMLHYFQETGQGYRADACANTGKKDRQPEARGAGTLKGGRYRVEVGSRWRFGNGQCFLCFRSRWGHSSNGSQLYAKDFRRSITNGRKYL